MPYTVRSHCGACTLGDEFVVGRWPEHAGVFVCQGCQRVVNVPLSTGQCPGCHQEPLPEDLYDYSLAVPCLNGDVFAPLEQGPTCPRCRAGHLGFRPTAHVNYGRLGATESGEQPWRGRDTMEKAIFTLALVGFCHSDDLDEAELLGYYNLDYRPALLAGRHVSTPIWMDIRAHLLSHTPSGEAVFTIGPKFQALLDESPLSRMMKEIEGAKEQRGDQKRKWWQFWNK